MGGLDAPVVDIVGVVEQLVCLATQVASEIAVESTSTAHQIAGGAAAYHGDPVLRALGDVQAARRHLMLARLHRPTLTRILVGLDAAYPPFVV
jgi:indole-3-acetate monooxygenase